MNINGIFNPQNRFWSFMEKIMNLCALGFLWLIFSIPLVTAGAATVALYQYTLRLSRNEEGYVWRTFFQGFRSNFLQATVLWLIMAAAGAFLILDLYGCQYIPGPSGVKWAMRVLLTSLLLVYVLASLYIFPLVAFFRTTVRKALVHSFVMAVGNLYVSVTVLVIYAIGGIAAYFMPMLFMVWFSLASYAASHLFGTVFYKYVKNAHDNLEEME